MTGALRILITNICLDNRSGTESVVRDLIVNFARRGHLPTLYAPRLGAPADELRQCGGHVVDRLDEMTGMPDIIHGHHNVPTVEAMARFSTCPAIFVAHDWRSWFDWPPDFERVHRYVAVDETRRDYLIRDVGIEPERVLILHNAVDLARIRVRQTQLDARPRRALAFTKTSEQMPALDEACSRWGITLGSLGRGTGDLSGEPEKLLVQQDLVFATGRSAIEALCCGAAVIVGDARGLAGMVTTANYAALRALNFGSGAFTRPITVDAIMTEIARYDRDNALAVAARIREDADLEYLLDRLEILYREAMAAGRSRLAWSAHDRRALRRFVKSWPPQAGPDAASWEPNRSGLAGLRRQIDKQARPFAPLRRIADAIGW